MHFFRISIIIFICLIISTCDKSVNPTNTKALIDIDFVADGFGDHNGDASDLELLSISNYFNIHQHAWTIGSIAGEYRDESIKEIPADTLVSTFSNMKLIGPYSSEFDLRKNLNGISFKTPWVGIYVITRNSQCVIIRFFRAPGPRIGEQDWVELLII